MRSRKGSAEHLGGGQQEVKRGSVRGPGRGPQRGQYEVKEVVRKGLGSYLWIDDHM